MAEPKKPAQKSTATKPEDKPTGSPDPAVRPEQQGLLIKGRNLLGQAVSVEAVVDITSLGWRELYSMKLNGALPKWVKMIDILLPRITGEIGSIKKGKETSSGPQYTYRGIDDALNGVSPVITRHGCRVTVEISDHDLKRLDKAPKRQDQPPGIEYHAQLTMKVCFIAPDGSKAVNVTRGEGADSMGGDKATNKAMSAALKYALFFGLLIPVHADEIEDSDAEGAPESELVKTAKRLIRQARGMAPIEQLRKRLEDSDAVSDEERTQLQMLLDDKAQQIESGQSTGK